MSKMNVKPISRKSDLVTQEHEKEVLIYDLLIDKAYSLNETSSLIWNLCNGENSVSEITANLSQKLNSAINEDFVWLALEQLKKDNLLANGEEISIDFGELSRRDVIRKIGFASLVTLPVISALIAPMAINASSTCSQSIQGCSGANRQRGCTCSPGTNAGNPSAPDGGTSNCATGLRCFLNRPLTYPGAPVGGTGNACC